MKHKHGCPFDGRDNCDGCHMQDDCRFYRDKLVAQADDLRKARMEEPDIFSRRGKEQG